MSKQDETPFLPKNHKLLLLKVPHTQKIKIQHGISWEATILEAVGAGGDVGS